MTDKTETPLPSYERLQKALESDTAAIGMADGTFLTRPAMEALLQLERTLRESQKDAERWRKARTIFSIEDIERAVDDMRGCVPDEAENLKADAAIDAALLSKRKES